MSEKIAKKQRKIYRKQVDSLAHGQVGLLVQKMRKTIEKLKIAIFILVAFILIQIGINVLLGYLLRQIQW